MNLIQLGVGEDGEPLIMEKLNKHCVLIHCAGNTESPFEFADEKSARQFASFLSKIRLEKVVEDIVHG